MTPTGWGVKAGHGWQVKLCDLIVTFRPYMCALEIGHDKALYKFTSVTSTLSQARTYFLRLLPHRFQTLRLFLAFQVRGYPNSTNWQSEEWNGLHRWAPWPAAEPSLHLSAGQRSMLRGQRCRSGRCAQCGGRSPQYNSASRRRWRGLSRQCWGRVQQPASQPEQELRHSWSHAVLPLSDAARDLCVNINHVLGGGKNQTICQSVTAYIGEHLDQQPLLHLSGSQRSMLCGHSC